MSSTAEAPLASWRDTATRRAILEFVARDVGQVRDVLRRAGADAPLVQVHRTIQDAGRRGLGR